MLKFFIYDTNGVIVGNPNGYHHKATAYRIAFHNVKVNSMLYAAYNNKRQSMPDSDVVCLFNIKRVIK